jgi:tetratricopeptide (TPR) repeat protein
MHGFDQVNEHALRKQFANRLKQLTKTSGNTLASLQKKTALSKGAIHDALNGKRRSHLDTVIKIVKACDGDEVSWRVEWAELNRALDDARDTGNDEPPGQRPTWQQPPPRQLPAAVADFVGRDSELDLLAEQLNRSTQGASIVAITSIGGTAGVGKTALALWWGNQVSDQFPDGQLYIDLRGHRPEPPRRSGEAVALVLGALGVPATRVPGDEDERAGLYRSLLAGKKMLVVLDNAASAEQVRPLLPNSPDCLVMVTSRIELPGLIAGNGARQIILDRLTPEEAVELLRRIVGQSRVDAEPDAAAEIARRCAYLPLALRVAAQRAMASSGFTLAEIVEQLTKARHHLDLLATPDNDQSMNVRVVFSWSYRALPTTSARMFRMLGLHAGPEISVPAAAALADVTAAEAEHLLEALAGVHLLERAGRSRYRFHDLLRDYAAEQAVEDETVSDRDAAVVRVLDTYLHTADAADRVLAPSRLRAPINPSQPVSHAVAFTSYPQALEWFDTERTNLTAAARQAAETGQDDIAWKIPVAMSVYCYVRKPWTDWIASHEIGLAAARRSREPFGEAAILTGLGAAEYERRQYQRAVDHLDQARSLWHDIDHQWGEAITLNILGSANRDLGRFKQAITCFDQALTIWPKINETWGKGVTLHNLGTTYRELGQPEDAVQWLHQAIEVRRAMPDRYGEAWALHDLGTIHAARHQFDDAIASFGQVLTIRREIGDRHGEAQTHYELGKAMHDRGSPEAGTEHLRQALTIFDDLHDPRAREVRARLETTHDVG